MLQKQTLTIKKKEEKKKQIIADGLPFYCCLNFGN